MDFPIGEKLLHLIVNPGTAPSPLPDGTPKWLPSRCHNWYRPRETCKLNAKFRSKRSNREYGPTFLDFPLFQGIF